jgi:hypothetical protein
MVNGLDIETITFFSERYPEFIFFKYMVQLHTKKVQRKKE